MHGRRLNAEQMQAAQREVQRWKPVEGANCRIKEQTGDGVLIAPRVSQFWQHPFQVTAAPVISAGAPSGVEWRAKVRAGFVNGRDVTIAMPAPKPKPGRNPSMIEVPLSDETAPSLVLSWRDPIAPAGVAASEEGDVYTLAGEGYPPYFEQLGARPPARDSRETQPFAPDAARTRELRACDIFLSTVRIATRSDVQVGDLFADGRSIIISTAITNDNARSAPSSYRLLATPRWRAPAEPTLLERMQGIAVEPETDEIKIATVWLLSPPDTAPGAEPDGTWAPYVQHSVFWNLFHASKNQLPTVQFEPIKFHTVIGLGVVDGLFQALLLPVNDSLQAIQNFFAAADFRGRFWSC